MNHVCTVLSILLLLFSVFGTANSSSSSGIILPAKYQSGTQTSSRPTTGTRRVTIAPLKQEAYTDKSVEEYWGYLNELDEYKIIFSNEEKEAADDLVRLGIRIIVKRQSEGLLKIRYRRTVTLRVQVGKGLEADNFDEFYVCKNLIETDYETVWKVLRRSCPIYSSNILEGFIIQNKLLSSVLILKSQPRVAELLSNEIYGRYIFTVNNTQNVLKYFMFQNDPIAMMIKFLQVYKPDAFHRLSALSGILTDLKVSNENVQVALNFIIKIENCPIQILGCFINSKRPLFIDQNDIERVFFNGIDHLKERVSLLKSSKDSIFIEKLVLKCSSVSNNSQLLKEILLDQELTNSLSAEFAIKMFKLCVYFDRINFMKFLLSTDLMRKIKRETAQFGSILMKSTDRITLESFKALVRAKMIKTNIPIFSSQDIIKSAYSLIKSKKNPEFLKFLVSERFIAPNQKVTLSNGETVSLLAVAVKEGNSDFIELLNIINWSKCKDVYEIDSFDDKIGTLLISKGAKFSSTASETNNPSSSQPTGVDLSKTEMTFETPEIKRPKLSETPNFYYKNALEAQDEDFICRLFVGSSEYEEFIRSYGYNQIIWDLYNSKMIRSLNQALDRIPVDLIAEIVREFAENECDYVVDYLIRKGYFNMETDCFDGNNLIYHLLKIRKADFALNLIERFKFNLSLSQDYEINPEGDIIISAVWNFDLIEKLLELGASPNVKINYQKLDKIISFKEYAKITNRTKLLQILEKYKAK